MKQLNQQRARPVNLAPLALLCVLTCLLWPHGDARDCSRNGLAGEGSLRPGALRWQEERTGTHLTSLCILTYRRGKNSHCKENMS